MQSFELLYFLFLRIVPYPRRMVPSCCSHAEYRLLMKKTASVPLALAACLSLLLVAGSAVRADWAPPCSGLSCKHNSGNAEPPDGFIWSLNNSCPLNCNLEKHNAGSSCTLTGGDVRCSGGTYSTKWWYTHTSTCSNNQCDFSNSYWIESSVYELKPTCLNQICTPGQIA